MFFAEVFWKRRILQLEKRNFKPESVAANFCAKEAFLKTFGKGLGDVELSKIQLLREASGKPYLKVNNVDFLEKCSK